nr:MAG TPA: hypothetical protein [Caudoviricetes sp.]
MKQRDIWQDENQISIFDILYPERKNTHNEEKPKRCIDPVIKFCQECKYGWIKYPEWVENFEDTLNCSFECGCTLGLEDTEPTEHEIAEYNSLIQRNEKHD